MPFEYENGEEIARDDLEDFSAWHHEGIGSLEHSPEGGMRMHCIGSAQSQEGTMVFFRPTLPDHIAVEYDVTIRSHGGLLINFLALRGRNGEDMITDRDKLPPRRGLFRDYNSEPSGLQSYHISFSRFNDKGEHTNTSNWRRNPGMLLAGYGNDPVQQLNRRYRIRLVKDEGHCQFYVDGTFAFAFIDRDTSRPIPDYGKFGFRLIGSNVMADVDNFRVYRIARAKTILEAAPLIPLPPK